MMDIDFIKQNAAESGDCGNGWLGWRLENTLYIEYTGPLGDTFPGLPYVPKGLFKIACWDERMKAEIRVLIIGSPSYCNLDLGLNLFCGWRNLERIDILTPDACYGMLDELDIEEDNGAWNLENHFDDLFERLEKLTQVNILAEDRDLCSIDGVIYDKKCRTLLFCPRGRQGHFTIPDGVETIGDFCFENCCSLTSISIPASVQEIGLAAFRRCMNLRLTVPESVSRIGGYAFENVPHILYHGSAQPSQFDHNWGAKNRN